MLKGMVALWQEADFAQAEDLFTEARTLATKFQSRSVAAYANYALAKSAYYQGEFEEARLGYEEFALDIVEQGVLSSAVEALCEAAECCILTGNLTHFRELVRAVQDPKLGAGAEARPLQVSVVLGVNAFFDGEGDDVQARFEEAMSLAKEGYSGESLPYLVYGVVLGVQGRDREAPKFLEKGTAILEAYSRRAELAVLPLRLRLLRRALEGAAPT